MPLAGFSNQGLMLTLPRGTTAIVITVRMGPTLLAARNGARIEVLLRDIPVVANVVPLTPWGYSMTF